MARTSNREKYHFDDFTERAYRDCLRLAKGSYRFIDYHHLNTPGRVCLWRHDIDTSPQRALALGKIEMEEGIASTYFILLHCDRYNALDYQTREVIHALQDLGHEVGLHFDPVYYGAEISDRITMEKRMGDERDILADITGKPVKVFSFHNPSVNGMIEVGFDEMAGMVNAFSAAIQKEFSYCSDSFCYWRYRRLLDVLQDESIERLHILTHPVCWTPEAMSPFARFSRAVRGRADSTLDRYLDNAKRHQRKIVR